MWTADVYRDESQYGIVVRGLHRVTCTPRKDDVDAMTRDLIALMTNTPTADIPPVRYVWHEEDYAP